MQMLIQRLDTHAHRETGNTLADTGAMVHRQTQGKKKHRHTHKETWYTQIHTET